MCKYISKPNKKDAINLLKRQDQVIIFRLRTSHVQLNAHLNRITANHPSNCNLCDHEEETVQHFLFHCPALQDIREQLLPKGPNLENTLFSTRDQLQQTCRYYKLANCRRAQVQMTTGSGK